ncbi:YqeB family protein [Actinomadura sp. WAC 06369]|uniref:YqeB family protein n=1 Tax=Actinomadura sp. WAC 06369 TaxID=2203193 RepID=UPI000F7965D4|nr:hypothetical protein [Actinomadura sp. WAC 06369]RSN50941.1 hypothetical protein DMH08_31685 [Actinomadura sp. WAC 06369]
MRKSTEQAPGKGRETVLSEPAWRTACVYVVCALVGAGLGFLVGPLADWLVKLPWAPMQGPAELVASIPSPWLITAGALAGLAIGFIAHFEQLTLRLVDDRVMLNRKGRDHEFARADVASAFRDGKHLVILGHSGAELFREECGLDFDGVAGAFTAHGYVWAGSDPHRDEFRRWVPGLSGLPEGANAVLMARAEPLKEKGPDADDVQELRRELARLGVVVRDAKRRQYVRTTQPTD